MRRSRSSLASAGALALVACSHVAAPAAFHPLRCPYAATADVTITNHDDAARAAGCTRLHSLTLRTAAAFDLRLLDTIREVTGDVTLGPTVAMDDLRLPGLTAIGGTLRVVGNGLAQGVFLPALARSGPIEIDGNPVLTTIALPKLTTAGALRVTANPSLELLDLVALTTVVGELVVTGAPRLAVLDAPDLRIAGRVELAPGQLAADVVSAVRGAQLTSGR